MNELKNLSEKDRDFVEKIDSGERPYENEEKELALYSDTEIGRLILIITCLDKELTEAKESKPGNTTLNQNREIEIREHNKECEFIGCDCGGTDTTVLLGEIDYLRMQNQALTAKLEVLEKERAAMREMRKEAP